MAFLSSGLTWPESSLCLYPVLPPQPFLSYLLFHQGTVTHWRISGGRWEWGGWKEDSGNSKSMKGQSTVSPSVSLLYSQLDVNAFKSSKQLALSSNHQIRSVVIWVGGGAWQITLNQLIHLQRYLQHRWGRWTSSNGQTIWTAASDTDKGQM